MKQRKNDVKMVEEKPSIRTQHMYAQDNFTSAYDDINRQLKHLRYSTPSGVAMDALFLPLLRCNWSCGNYISLHIKCVLPLNKAGNIIASLGE